MSVVPFYLYPPERFSLYTDCEKDTLSDPKHGNALLFIQRLREHRWRVSDIKAAAVAVVPALLDWFANGLCGRKSGSLRWNHLKNLTLEVNATYAKTRHLLIAADWQSFQYLPLLRASFREMIFGTYLGPQPRGSTLLWPKQLGQNCTFAIGYLANYDAYAVDAPWHNVHQYKTREERKFLGLGEPSIQSQPIPYVDVTARRTINFEFIGAIHNRSWFFKDRWMLFHHASKLGAGNIIITSSPPAVSDVRPCEGPRDELYCHRLISRHETQRIRAVARFSIFMRGEDLTSDRLVNALTALQIPVLVGSDTLSVLPFPFAVPWHRLVVVVHRHVFRADPVAALANATSTLTDQDIEERRRLITMHLPDVIWNVLGSRVHENILLAAAGCRCGPMASWAGRPIESSGLGESERPWYQQADAEAPRVRERGAVGPAGGRDSSVL